MHLASPAHLVFHSQKKLKTGTDELPREEKLAVLKDCLALVGERIDTVVANKLAKGEDAEKYVLSYFTRFSDLS